jgi:hypothetical protein
MSADFRACQDGRSWPSVSWRANLGTRGESRYRRLVFVDEVSGYDAATSQPGSVSYSSSRGRLLGRKTHGATRRTKPERCMEWYHTPQSGRCSFSDSDLLGVGDHADRIYNRVHDVRVDRFLASGCPTIAAAATYCVMTRPE